MKFFKSILSVLLHLRIPFSWFLLPFFLAALCISPNFDGMRLGLVFLVLHFLVYPAANAFNSYFDRDEKNIGGLKNPPLVNIGLYYVSAILDLLAIVLAWKISFWFSMGVAGYACASRLYSHPSVRIKRYPIFGWLFTSFFQGYYTVCVAYLGLNGYEPWNLINAKVQFMGLICSLILMAIYPLTQIYQHEADFKRGDLTLSQMLGIKKTMIISFILFLISAPSLVLYIQYFLFHPQPLLFFITITPAVLFMIYWTLRVYSNDRFADYTHVMWFNILVSTGMNYFFFKTFLLNTNVLQAI